MNGVNDGQLRKFREADWKTLQIDLVKYAEKKVRRHKWRSGGFLPKGLEPPDLVAISVTKTLNAILGEDDGGIATWNEEANPTLAEHLRSAIDTEVANLVRSEEHKKTNYSPQVDNDEAQELLKRAVNSQAKYSLSEQRIEVERFDEFKCEVLNELEGDEDAQLLLLTYEELATTNEVVKPGDAAVKMGVSVEKIYNLVKKLRRAADRVSDRMEKKYGK